MGAFCVSLNGICQQREEALKKCLLLNFFVKNVDVFVISLFFIIILIVLCLRLNRIRIIRAVLLKRSYIMI